MFSLVNQYTLLKHPSNLNPSHLCQAPLLIQAIDDEGNYRKKTYLREKMHCKMLVIKTPKPILERGVFTSGSSWPFLQVFRMRKLQSCFCGRVIQIGFLHLHRDSEVVLFQGSHKTKDFLVP